METAIPPHASAIEVRLGRAWPLLLGYAVLVAPTLVSLGSEFWSREIGAHGPIILATGLWLLWRQLPEFRREAAPGSILVTAAILTVSLASYIFGRTYGFLFLEVSGVYGVGLSILYAKIGPRLMLRNWFPLLYLAFSIPPPTWVIDALTLPLKQFATVAATDGLHAFGIPIAREGVTIFVAQYQLLVEDACSGMHSIVGLIAISLLYVYLMHGPSWRYALLFVCLAIPIAILANTLRIVVLVLLTYFFGDEVAQGFLHFTAGILLFATALLLMFAIDKGITWIRGRVAAQRSAAS